MRTENQTGGLVGVTKNAPVVIFHLFLLFFAIFGALGHPLGRILVGQGTMGQGSLGRVLPGAFFLPLLTAVTVGYGSIGALGMKA